MNISEFEIDIDSVAIKNVLLFPHEKAASLFVDKMQKRFPAFYILSADRKFPRNEHLNKMAFQALASDENIQVIVFGESTYSGVEIATQRVFVVDQAILCSSSPYNSGKFWRLNWDEDRLTWLLQSLYFQWNFMDLANNNGFRGRPINPVQKEKLGWAADLLE